MQWIKEKQKEEGEREKQALHCDKEYAAVIEFDLRKLKKKPLHNQSRSPVNIIHSAGAKARILLQ